MGKWTRRAFIGAGTLVGGGFVLGVAGVAFAPGRHSVVSDGAEEKGELTTWITVTPDNVTTILIPHCEMGQGSQTALAMMAAEEMEAGSRKPPPSMPTQMPTCCGRLPATRYRRPSVARSTTGRTGWPAGSERRRREDQRRSAAPATA